MLSIIAVIGKNRELGKDNKLLWHIPGDLPRFKHITSDHPVIMGKNTYLSIGKPLKNRTNIVVSTTIESQQGIILAKNINEAITIAQKSPGNDEIFVIGGGSIYTQTIDRADRLYLTIVDASTDADTFFPPYDAFNSIFSSETKHEDGFTFTYLILEKI